MIWEANHALTMKPSSGSCITIRIQIRMNENQVVGRINNSNNWIWPNEKLNMIYFFFMFSFIYLFIFLALWGRAGLIYFRWLYSSQEKWNKWQIPGKRMVDRLKWMVAEQTHIFCAKHNFPYWIIFEKCIVSFIISCTNSWKTRSSG